MVYQKDLTLEKDWNRLIKALENRVGKKPKDLNAVIFLIGVQELGFGAKNYDKEEKQDLMHIAICKILSYSGYYELDGIDENGWPHWKLLKPLPHFDLLEQEKLLKMHILEYFEKEIGIY
ncbi:MAG: hypothetical protein CMB80_07400 [Flammeovirgaceae bacterium]|nr:hypothetical protein [Flammeovirgaceae bacterium]MBE62977.1 hypothetical protein [Flammeovirgaceae bacterium]MBR06986.1 hypothetical protein [Rickettsiales bacterium]|tara:strand:+ start:217 stop:576 length:360 start_codon:yes stop_codon:yes gene_type:complete